MKRRRLAAAAALVCAMVLSACSGLPTTGPVNAGYNAEDAPTIPDLSFRPRSPQPGATGQQIVAGFLDAATSPEGNWAIAQEFLTEEFRAEWQAAAGVTVAEPGTRSLESVEGSDRVEMTYTPVADVDEFGTYSVAGPETQTLEFGLEEVEGQWRISDAPPGVILDNDFFVDVYRSYSLMFFDSSWSYLVPDIRWFPYRSSGVATRIARALVDGRPSEWLTASVFSAFPEGTALESGSVVSIDADGVAQIALTDAAATAPPEVLARMQRQLLSSLRTAGIADVAMTVGGVELDVAASGVLPTTVEAWPLVMTEGEVGYLTSDGLEALPGGIGQVIAAATPTSFALGRAGDTAALQLPDGAVGRATAEDGFWTIDDRAGLIEPVIDTAGYVWTVPRNDPTLVRAIAADGEFVEVAGAWPGASAVSSMQISRDGTRVAAVTTEGGRDWVSVAGIIRDEDGTAPLQLGVPHRLAPLQGGGFSVAWLDDATVGVLVRGETDVRVLAQTVGGLGSDVAAPAVESVDIAAGSSAAVPRVLTADGVLFARRGSAWTLLARPVQVLGTQLGAE